MRTRESPSTTPSTPPAPTSVGCGWTRWSDVGTRCASALRAAYRLASQAARILRPPARPSWLLLPVLPKRVTPSYGDTKNCRRRWDTSAASPFLPGAISTTSLEVIFLALTVVVVPSFRALQGQGQKRGRPQAAARLAGIGIMGVGPFSDRRGGAVQRRHHHHRARESSQNLHAALRSRDPGHKPSLSPDGRLVAALAAESLVAASFRIVHRAWHLPVSLRPSFLGRERDRGDALAILMSTATRLSTSGLRTKRSRPARTLPNLVEKHGRLFA